MIKEAGAWAEDELLYALRQRLGWEPDASRSFTAAASLTARQLKRPVFSTSLNAPSHSDNLYLLTSTTLCLHIASACHPQRLGPGYYVGGGTVESTAHNDAEATNCNATKICHCGKTKPIFSNNQYSNSYM
jgi:hypothetical protein